MGWGTPPTQSWVRSSAGALSPSRSPYRALTALQAPSCPQNPVVQPSLHPQEDEDGPGHIKGTLRRGHPWHTAAPCPPCSPVGAAPCESEAGRAELAAGHRSPRGSGARKRAADTGRGRAGGTSQPAAPSRSPACRPRLPLGLRSSPCALCEMKGTGVGHASCGTPSWPVSVGSAFGKAGTPCPCCRVGKVSPGLTLRRWCPGTRCHHAQGQGAAPHRGWKIRTVTAASQILSHTWLQAKQLPREPGGPVSPCQEG